MTTMTTNTMVCFSLAILIIVISLIIIIMASSTGTFDVESFRSHPLYDPWSKASRYMNDKLRFITKYIPLTPGPNGNH
jgi:hypothetical protein